MSIVVSEPAQELESVFRDYARLVYRTAFGVTGSHVDAEDVLQTVFLQLIRSKFPPDLSTNPEAYLYRAAVNTALNIVERRRREVLVDESEHFAVPASSDADKDEADLRRLYEAIAELKPDAAEILILRYMHNKSDAEIGRMLGKSRGTIALKLFRTRARLKNLLLANRKGDRP